MSPSASYAQATRHPLPCLCLALPLLALYAGGMAWLAGQGFTPPRTGLDEWIHEGLRRCGLPWAGAPSLVVLGCILAWAVFAWKTEAPDLLGTTSGMALESVIAALALWGLFYFQQPLLKACGLQVAGGRSLLLASQCLSYVGAGLFEEAVFRLALFSLLWLLFRLAFGQAVAVGLAVLLSAIAFAGAHHLGPQGESWNQAIFLFRLLAGVYFALLFQFRGFGVAVGSHVAYDVLVGLAGR